LALLCYWNFGGASPIDSWQAESGHQTIYSQTILVLSSVLANLFISILGGDYLIPTLFTCWPGGYLLLYSFPWFSCFISDWSTGSDSCWLALLFIFRDLSHIWDVLVNILFFCSPIIYPLSIVPGELVPYYLVNPMTKIIIVFRDIMVAGKTPPLFDLAIIAGFAAGFLLIGSYAFGKLQRRFAEAI
jgi:ABC-type polysaccharide/polyol phosphate export permease